jgi:hypothetical protein
LAAVRPRSRHIFSYDEALGVFPVVRDRTAEAVAEVTAFARTLAAGGGDDEGERAAIEEASREAVARWTAEIEALGCEVKGLWLVDFDAGDGYYCWKYPEPTLAHFHGYDEGFPGRVPVA